MAGFLSKIIALGRNRTTYAVGLLQTKAYRALKQHTTQSLKRYEISTIEWAFLGVLYEEKDMRLNHAAIELGVEAPFVTQMLVRLTDRKLVAVSQDASDSRAKKAALTKVGREFVETVEEDLKKKTAVLLKGIKANDLLTYLAVMEAFVKNCNTEDMPKDLD